MIRFSLSVRNPFKLWHRDWSSIRQYEWIVSKNKTLEIGFFRHFYDILSVSVDLNWRGRDHAGPEVEIYFLGVGFRAAISDHRHWDQANNNWKIYE